VCIAHAAKTVGNSKHQQTLQAEKMGFLHVAVITYNRRPEISRTFAQG
jgi:hypothetical protein